MPSKSTYEETFWRRPQRYGRITWATVARSYSLPLEELRDPRSRHADWRIPERIVARAAAVRRVIRAGLRPFLEEVCDVLGPRQPQRVLVVAARDCARRERSVRDHGNRRFRRR